MATTEHHTKLTTTFPATTTNQPTSQAKIETNSHSTKKLWHWEPNSIYYENMSKMFPTANVHVVVAYLLARSLACFIIYYILYINMYRIALFICFFFFSIFQHKKTTRKLLKVSMVLLCFKI